MRTHRHAVLMIAGMCLGAAVAGADVSPGDKIDETNVDKVKELVSPGRPIFVFMVILRRREATRRSMEEPFLDLSNPK